MKNQVQLITYIDRLSGGGIAELHSLLTGPLRGVFGGVHLLPFFYPIDGSDAGFDPIDHTRVDPRLGEWEDIRNLASSLDVMADVIVNHASRQSRQFEDFSRNGEDSDYGRMFLTLDRVFPNGATEAQLLKIYRPRPGLPFTSVTLANGEKRLLWTTFTPEQVDLNVGDAKTQEYLSEILRRFREAGITSIRLDAAGYAIKKAGTSCFMIPETFSFIKNLTQQAKSLGMDVLVEIHSYYKQQIEIARQVDLVYDFALPPLVLHALFAADFQPLLRWLKVRPSNTITVLDTHDGIGVIDVGADADGQPGLLGPSQIDQLVETIHSRSNGESKRATGAAANNLDLYQVNCTYLDALGRDENLYLIARSIQFFVPGIPQIYYVGLLGAINDMDLLARSGVGRNINRHYFSKEEVESQLATPLVRRLVALICLRNAHPAFAGECSIESSARHSLEVTWKNNHHVARLAVDSATAQARLHFSGEGERQPVELQIG
jgi:sucrose phosphorylase